MHTKLSVVNLSISDHRRHPDFLRGGRLKGEDKNKSNEIIRIDFFLKAKGDPSAFLHVQRGVVRN